MNTARIAQAARNIRKAIAAQLFARWSVSITWEGQRVTHWAKDEDEAREWLACYPKECRAVVEFFPFFCNGPAPLLIAGRNI